MRAQRRSRGVRPKDPTLRNPCGRALGEYVEVAWVISEAGVSYAAFRDWRVHRGYTKCPSFWRSSGRTFVRWEVAEEYLNGDGIPRVPNPPTGWVPIARAKELMGVSGEYLTKAARRGELTAVRCRQQFYFEPDALNQMRENHNIPGGWKTTADLARELGLDPRTILSRAKALGINKRLAPDRRAQRRVRWFSPLEAEMVRSYRDIRRSVPDGWVRCADEAEKLGWNRRSPLAWAKHHGYPMAYVSVPGQRGTASYCPKWVWDEYVKQRRRNERKRRRREAA